MESDAPSASHLAYKADTVHDDIRQSAAALLRQINETIQAYDFGRRTDNFCYNWGTGLAVLLNTFATIIPQDAPAGLYWSSKAAGGIATAWIAIDRILLFGPRWKFGLMQQAALRSARVDLLEIDWRRERSEQIAILDDVKQQVRIVLSRDDQVPGITGVKETDSRSDKKNESRTTTAYTHGGESHSEITMNLGESGDTFTYTPT